jgi:hypothetical protein
MPPETTSRRFPPPWTVDVGYWGRSGSARFALETTFMTQTGPQMPSVLPRKGTYRASRMD